MRTLLLLTALLSFPLHAAVNAHVNQHTVSLGDALQLTIEADQKLRQNPDLSGLGQNFRIIGSKQMSISSYSSGERRVTTRWQVMLRPLRDGSLTIPAIPVGDEASSPIRLNVLANEKAAPALLSQSLILETELDTNEIYIHSQALLNVKLYHRNPLPKGASLSDPITSDAVIKALGEPKQYQAPLRGQSYHVLEQNYGIYPKYSGLIKLEPLSFNDGQPDSLPQVLQKEPIELAVLPKAQQKNPGYWIPAKNVALRDNLQQRNSAALGEGIKRVITLEAQGILASELPSLSSLKNELADVQLDNVILEETFTEKGIISSRTEELTITPLERGEITLREIRVPWWDVVQDKEQETRLPATLINVSAARPAAVVAATPPPQLSSNATDNAVAEQPVTAGTDEMDNLSLLIWLLTGLAIVSSLGWLYTFNRMRKRQSAGNSTQPLESSSEYDEVDLIAVAEGESFQQLALACTQNDCEASRLLVIEWAQYFWPQVEIYSSEDVAIAAASQTFDLLLMDMEHHLNHGEAHLWRGDLLLEAVSRIRERHNPAQSPDNSYSQDVYNV